MNKKPTQEEMDLTPPLTRLLAHFVANHPSRGWSDDVEHEAQRTFMNWLGCAVGAARHPTTVAALAAVEMLQPSAQATVLGRREKVDIASAALLNGISSHTFDFDDTHLKTVIHPAGPVASALLALAEHTNASGRMLNDALVIGIDVACRVGMAMYPDHYDRGWHITGSTGMLGAAAGAARILKLDEDQTAMALGLAASQPVGLREQFGTMAKPFHPGGAARAGLMSALMAKHGFTSSPRALEAPRGFLRVISDKADWEQITDELGGRFEISFNTYKPFACGIVVHPGIDACIQLRAQGVRPEDVERISLRVHPLVLELTGKKEPQDGLQSKFSIYHGCAVGLAYGRAGEKEFSDEVVLLDGIAQLRRRIVAEVDTTVAEASVRVTAVLKDGRTLEIDVEDAIGSLRRPMSDKDLENKFCDLSEPVLGRRRTRSLIEGCWGLSAAATVRSVAELSRPEPG